MPNADPLSNIVLALIVFGALLLVVLLTLWRVLMRLQRIEAALNPNAKGSRDGSSDAPTAAETSAGGAFEAFLGEDPARRGMTKSEQFTAFRRWRQEKGMNWTKP